jgi:hypothetical protein
MAFSSAGFPDGVVVNQLGQLWVAHLVHYCAQRMRLRADKRNSHGWFAMRLGHVMQLIEYVKWTVARYVAKAVPRLGFSEHPLVSRVRLEEKFGLEAGATHDWDNIFIRRLRLFDNVRKPSTFKSQERHEKKVFFIHHR